MEHWEAKYLGKQHQNPNQNKNIVPVTEKMYFMLFKIQLIWNLD